VGYDTVTMLVSNCCVKRQNHEVMMHENKNNLRLRMRPKSKTKI